VDEPRGALGPSNTPRSARQVAFGRRSSEGADPGEQLALGEWAARLDLDPSLAAVAVVIGADLLGEVLDHLAVTYQQQIIVDRQRLGDLDEEGPHVLVAVALAGRVLLGGLPSGRTVPAGDRGVDAVAHGELRTPTQHRGRVGRNPDTGGAGTGHRSPSFPWAVVESATSRFHSRPRGATGCQSGSSRSVRGYAQLVLERMSSTRRASSAASASWVSAASSASCRPRDTSARKHRTADRVAAGMDGRRLWPAQPARARRRENDPTPW